MEGGKRVRGKENWMKVIKRYTLPGIRQISTRCNVQNDYNTAVCYI